MNDTNEKAAPGAHTPGLSQQHIESMLAVANGADVLSYGIAKDLREVQLLYPEFISIGKRMHHYKATARLPYFGAILTDAGRAAIAKATGGAA